MKWSLLPGKCPLWFCYHRLRPAFAALIVLGIVFAELEANAFYQEPVSFTNPSHVITLGSPGYLTNQANDTSVFQSAINDVANAGGGKVIVPADSYSVRNVELKSNVHLVFDGDSTITVNADGGNPNKGIHAFGMGTDSVEQNTSIRAINGTPRVILNKDEHERSRAFSISDVQNFLLSNFTIQDTLTTFSGVSLSWDQHTGGTPTNGTVERIAAHNAHYGYGAIQIQAGRNVSFRDIESTGGVALRLETGWKLMNLQSPSSGLFDIHAEDITSYGGQAALMLSPHSMHHGDIFASDIKSVGSEYAVHIENGSLHKFTDEEIATHGLTEGTWNSINIDGVDATFGYGPIETRFVHYLHYPEELHPLVYDSGAKISQFSSVGPSIVPVHNVLLGDPSVTIENITSRGFNYHPNEIDESYYYSGHWRDVIAGEAPPVVSGDLDFDGDVDSVDLEIMFVSYGRGDQAWHGDFDADGDVDGADFLHLQRRFGVASSQTAVAVPEPATAAIFTWMLVVAISQRAEQNSMIDRLCWQSIR